MTQLSNTQVALTYPNILNCGGATPGLSSTLTIVQDGYGNSSPMRIATNAVNFDRNAGQFQLDGVALTATATQLNNAANGIFTINGTASQINSSTVGNTATLSLPAFITLPTSTGSSSININGMTLFSNGFTSSITSADDILIHATGVQKITLQAGFDVEVSAPRLSILGGSPLRLYDTNNLLSISLSAQGLVGSAVYNLPVVVPTSDTGMALSCDIAGFMSWQKFQLLETETVNTSQGMTVNASYVVNGGTVNLLLPPISAVNDIIKIRGNTGSWTITQGSGQSIKYLASSTTVGVGGSLTISGTHGCIEVTCIVANTTWVVSNFVGTISLV